MANLVKRNLFYVLLALTGLAAPTVSSWMWIPVVSSPAAESNVQCPTKSGVLALTA